MTYVPNPFRARLAEQQRDVMQFLRTFGAGMLEALPDDDLWNRLLVIRSAPGAGKTSILRMLTPSSLGTVVRSRDDFAELYSRLSTLRAVSPEGLLVLGILVSVGRDYRSLTDLGPTGDAGRKVFFKLLDARILARFVQAIAAASSIDTQDRNQVEKIEVRLDSEGTIAAYAIGIPFVGSGDSAVSGTSIFAQAQRDETEILQLLDSLVPVQWDLTAGHSNLYAMRLLSHCNVWVDGKLLPPVPLVLFDDVHDLSDEQREQLSVELLDRGITAGRWIAERTSAQSEDEVLGNATSPGRDREVVWLEDAMTKSKKGSHTKTLQRLFGAIADARAVTPLRLLDTSEPFTQVLESASLDLPKRSSDKAIGVDEAFRRQAQRGDDLVVSYPHLAGWWDRTHATASGIESYRGLIQIREFEILARRDLARGLVPLFAEEDEAIDRSASDTREAARLFVSEEYKLPYYFGATAVSDLGSRNVEQYLDLAGGIFDLMIASATIGRSAAVSAWEQDRQVKKASAQLWGSLVQRVPDGEQVAALLHAIAFFSRGETYRKTAPYAPGATGIAISASDMERLLAPGPTGRSLKPLAKAIANAVSFNFLEMQRVSSKNEQVVVFYLNRLLCPHFQLPLGRGGFREQTLPKLAQWLEIASTAPAVIPDPAVHLDGIGRTVEIGSE